MSVLPDDEMNSDLKFLTTKSTWDDLILYHEGPSDVKESRVMDLKLCYNTFKFKEAPLSTAFFSTSIIQDSQNSLDDEEDIRSSQEYMNDLEEKYQARALLAKSKMFFKKGIDQLTIDTSSSRPKDPVFVKSSADNSEVSITTSNKSKLSEAEDSTMSNHDTGKVPSNDSQRNTTDHSVIVFDSSVTQFVAPPSSNGELTGAKPVYGPKTIKSILKSKSIFKAGTLKGIKINEPSSAPARGNKGSSASKTNSAPASKLKNVKIEDDPPLDIVMKELNELKLQISKNKSFYFRNKNSQQVPPNALQNKYKAQFKMNCEQCGQNNHLSENYYEVLFCKNCKRTNHRTCD
nr:retrovirus-related Pol polyprotein from transposon TNT 1-94 [Tanacetum cinerariifolium]